MHVQKTVEQKLAPTTLYEKAKLRTFTSFVRKYELEPKRERVAGENENELQANEYDSLPK